MSSPIDMERNHSVAESCTTKSSHDSPQFVANMSKPKLPTDVLIRILEQYLLVNSVSSCLGLRCVNRWVDEEIIRLLFIVKIKDISTLIRGLRVPDKFAVAYLQGFFCRAKIPCKIDRQARRAIFRSVGYTEIAGPLSETCFTFRGRDPCLKLMIGSSETTGEPRCDIHDMMYAMTRAFGTNVFNLGTDTSDDGYEKPGSKTSRYWSLLLSCYRNEKTQVSSTLQDIMTEQVLPDESVIRMFLNCFLIAVRKDYADMVDVLYETAKDREDVLTRLGQESYHWNSLIESIKLGRVEVFKTLLKWRWKFGEYAVAYLQCLKTILREKMEVDKSKELETRKLLLQAMLEWTEEWRNIAEMKGFLMKAGKYGLAWALEIAIDTLKKCHFFRHERGNEGTFSAAEPLASIVRSENPKMIRSFIDHRTILLPHTSDDDFKVMRQRVINAEIDRRGSMRKGILELIIECSQDIVEEKTSLQDELIICLPYSSDPTPWMWLARKVGLDSPCKNYDDRKLGSVLLEKAVSHLHVDTVRSLTISGAKLDVAAKTFQVDEGDEAMMERLHNVQQALLEQGQGEVKEKKIVETTFLPNTSEPARVDKGKAPATVTVEELLDVSTSVASPRSYCPKFLRRNILARRKRVRKSSQKSSPPSKSPTPSL